MEQDKNKRLSVLSTLEEFAFYGLPDFDDQQRSIYFNFNEGEISLILSRQLLYAQVYYALQIGYFKAKKTFFKFSLKTAAQADVHYILARYFSNSRLDDFNITKYEYYQQCDEICDLFGYKRWKNDFLLELYEHASNIIKRDTNPNYLALSLLDFLEDKRIVRPGYTTLQDAISFALISERNRIKLCL